MANICTTNILGGSNTLANGRFYSIVVDTGMVIPVIDAKTINADVGNIIDIKATDIKATDIKATDIETTNIDADAGNIDTIDATTGNIDIINSDEGNIDVVTSETVYCNSLGDPDKFVATAYITNAIISGTTEIKDTIIDLGVGNGAVGDGLNEGITLEYKNTGSGLSNWAGLLRGNMANVAAANKFFLFTDVLPKPDVSTDIAMLTRADLYTAALNSDTLTASRLTASDANKSVISTNLINWIAGTANRVTMTSDGIGGAIADIAATYIGQNSITTLGTIGTGIWQGTSIGTTYTDAKIKTVTGTNNRVSIAGTATDPIWDIAATYVGQTSITTLGTIGTGTWNGSIIQPAYGGTGINNGTNTLSLDGNLATSGNFASTFTMTADTNVTFPTSGTLATTSGTITSLSGTANRITVSSPTGSSTINIAATYIGQTSITTLGTIGIGAWQGTVIDGAYLNYNTSNLKITASKINTIQDITTLSSPTFFALTTNTVDTPGTILNIGTTNASSLNLGQSGGGTLVIVPNLSASGLVATDGGKTLTSSVSGLSPTFSTITASVTLLSNNMDSATATTLSIGANTQTAISLGRSGTTISCQSDVLIVPLTASGLVATDGSKQLTSTISGLSPVFTGLGLSGLTASSLVATDGSKNLTNTISGISPTFSTITASVALKSPSLDVASAGTLSIGTATQTAISLGKSGTVITNASDNIMSTLSASGLVATNGSKQLTSTISGLSPVFANVTGSNSLLSNIIDASSASTLAIGTITQTAISLGRSGTTVTIDSTILPSTLTASKLVATDGSKNLTSTTSGLSPAFTAVVLTALSTINASSGSLQAPTTFNTYLQIAGADSAAPTILIDSFGGGTSHLVGRFAAGTPGLKSAIQSGFTITQFGAQAYGSTAYSATDRAYISMLARENWTDTKQGTYISFATTNLATTTTSERLRLDYDGSLFPIPDNSGSCGIASFRWSTIYAATGTINTSDSREKKEIVDLDMGLPFIQSLRPRKYKFNNGIRSHYGLLAQEVKATLDEFKTDFGGYVNSNIVSESSTQAPTDIYGLRYEEFISPMIKAIQDLAAQNMALSSRIAILENLLHV